MNTVTLNVPNISCGHCVHTIQMELEEVEGVKDIQASAETKQVIVRFEEPASVQSIKDILAEINYPSVD